MRASPPTAGWSSVRRSAIVQLVWRLVAGGFSLLATAVTVVGLSTATQGLYAVTWSLVSLTSLAIGGGLSTAVSWAIATRLSTVRNCLQVATVVSMALLCPPALAIVILQASGALTDRVLWIAALAALPFFLFVQIALAILVGEGRTTRHAILLAAQPLGLLLVALALAMLNVMRRGSQAAELLVVLPVIGQTVIAVFLILARGHTRVAGLGGRALLIRLVSFTWRSYFGNLAAYVNARADLVLVGVVVGPTGAGIYSVATALGESLTRFAQSIGTVLFARVAAPRPLPEAIGQAALLARASGFVGFLGAGILAVILAVASSLSADTYAVAVVLLLLAPGIGAIAVAIVYSALYAARGQPEIPSRIALMTAPLALVLYSSLVPTIGVYGGALASSVSYAALALLSLRFVKLLR